MRAATPPARDQSPGGMSTGSTPAGSTQIGDERGKLMILNCQMEELTEQFDEQAAMQRLRPCAVQQSGVRCVQAESLRQAQEELKATQEALRKAEAQLGILKAYLPSVASEFVALRGL